MQQGHGVAFGANGYVGVFFQTEIFIERLYRPLLQVIIIVCTCFSTLEWFLASF